MSWFQDPRTSALRSNTRAGNYNEVVVLQSYSSTAKDYVEVGRFRAAVSQSPSGPHAVQHNIQFRTRYRTDIGPQNMLLWRGGRHFIQHALDLGMQKREITIFAYDGIPMTLVTPSSGGTFTAKTAGALSQGAATVTLGTLQTGLTAVASGDYFTVSPYSQRYVVTNTVTASAGQLAGETFTPATTGAVAAAAAVNLTKASAPSYNFYGDVDSYAATEVNGSQILATDVRVFVLMQQLASAGFTATPTINDKIVVNNRTRTILDVITIFHDGSPVAYQMQCR